MISRDACLITRNPDVLYDVKEYIISSMYYYVLFLTHKLSKIPITEPTTRQVCDMVLHLSMD